MDLVITWNNTGGAIDSRLVRVKDSDDMQATAALIEMIKDTPVHAGDTFTIEEVK